MGSPEVEAELARRREEREWAAVRRGADGTSYGMLFRPPYIDAPIRRILGNDLLRKKTIFPYEVVYQQEDTIRKATEHLRSGGGVMGVLTHLNMRDNPQAIAYLSEMFPSYPLYSPVAEHQVNLKMKLAASWWGVKWNSLVTPSTLRRYLERQRRGEKVQIPTREERERKKDLYLDHFVATLESPGIAIISPWGTRSATFRPFEGNPIGHIVDHAKQRGLANIGFLPIGMGIKGRETCEVGRYELGETFELNVGEFTLLEDIEGYIAENPVDPFGNERTIDTEVQDLLLRVAPAGMRPLSLESGGANSPSSMQHASGGQEVGLFPKER